MKNFTYNILFFYYICGVKYQVKYEFGDKAEYISALLYFCVIGLNMPVLSKQEGQFMSYLINEIIEKGKFGKSVRKSPALAEKEFKSYLISKDVVKNENSYNTVRNKLSSTKWIFKEDGTCLNVREDILKHFKDEQKLFLVKYNNIKNDNIGVAATGS